MDTTPTLAVAGLVSAAVKNGFVARLPWQARPEASAIHNIAVINFGGIGDEVLFSPVIDALKRQLPHACLTLILETRSQGTAPLLPGLDLAADDQVIAIDLSRYSRQKLFFVLAGLLSKNRFDAVLSSGSSPFIAPMLFASGVPYRVGYDSGLLARMLLSEAAPLNQKQYASAMYYSLAETFLKGLLGSDYQPPASVVPALAKPADEDLQWAKAWLQHHLDVQVASCDAQRPKASRRKIILLHPGSSLMSVRKHILKGWPTQQWAALIGRLATTSGADTSYQVILVGGPDDAQVVEDILQALCGREDLPGFTNAYGETKSLGQLAALIYQADLLISVDSAPMHLAVGYQKPVVAMFGPTDEAKLLPMQSPRFQAVRQEGLSCRPCLWDVRQTSCEQPICLDVSVEHMYQAVMTALRSADLQPVSLNGVLSSENS